MPSSSRFALVSFMLLIASVADAPIAQAQHVVAQGARPRAVSSPPSTLHAMTSNGYARGTRAAIASGSLRRQAATPAVLLSEAFSGSATTPNAWVYGGSACITAGNSSATPTPATSVPACGANAPQDPYGLGALELTRPRNFDSGYVFSTRPYLMSAGLSVTFDYFSFNASGPAGDGLAVVLTDASKALPTTAGGCCGSLGYATDLHRTPMLANSYLGVGFDETGYFTAANENKSGGLPGLLANIISVRGAAVTNAQYLFSSTNAGGQAAALPFQLNSPAATARPAPISVNVTLTSAGLLSVSFDRHDGQGLLTYLGPKPVVGVNGQPAPPASVYLGFLSAGGGANARHQIQNVVVTAAPSSIPPVAATSVLTYHNDTNRTGWNPNETALTTANVGASTFGLLHTVAVDGRVDAQPLVVAKQLITGQGTHDVVYVATENNSVYAIDGNSGTILRSRNLGLSIPNTAKDYDDNVYPVYGILSTPVIDRAANAIFLVTDTNEGAGATDVYRLHKLALDSLGDLVPSVVLTSVTKLSDGSSYVLPAKHERQRPGLLEVNGAIYVAFGSTGDTQPALSRGVVAGFSATNLSPLYSNVVPNRLHAVGNSYYLSSIWQSGYGIAADSQGNIYFSTGNSDNMRPSYDAKFNYPDSVVKVSGDLSRIIDTFTQYNYFAQDQGDGDFGSGGTLVIPDQFGGIYPRLLVAGGKDGRAYILNRDSLGGFAPGGPNRDLAELSNGGCWCGPAYFVGADSVPRIVTGGSNGVRTWKIHDGSSLSITLEGQVSGGNTNGQPDGGGTIPAISSNGTLPGSAILWFVQRPNETRNYTVNLRAYDAANLSTQLFASGAGSWSNYNSNANLVPTVVNGHVYVGSYKQLQIFGLFDR